ncbi:SH3 domain-containing protein [Dyadobacter jejuensis]|nr:SH3 domain-containing protein [Dyadobacter jejuensis]
MAQYTEALSLYKKNFTNSEKNNQPMVLKLAFLSERTGNYSDVLFYLSQLALVNPSRTLFEKMDKMASEHNLKGYDFNDYSYFIIFYRRYGAYLPLLLLVFGAYIIYIMYWKTKRRQGILIVHKLSILTYLLVVGVIINLPSLYRSAVITNPKTFLRENPTAAASVVDRVGKGHRVTILGSVDHWYRIIWNNSIVYIRHSDVRNI